MRIGYPCINLSLDCRPSRTLRLANLTPERLRALVAGNLACLERIVRWNAERGLLREVYPDGRTLPEALAAARATWGPHDGPPMVDYSSPLPGGRPGRHAHTLDEAHFRRFLAESTPLRSG